MKNTGERPSIIGQICRIASPLPDEDPEEVYVVAEDPAPFADDDTIYVASLSELQKNISQAENTPQIPVLKGDLLVIADSLEEYVHSWNTK